MDHLKSLRTDDGLTICDACKIAQTPTRADARPPRTQGPGTRRRNPPAPCAVRAHVLHALFDRRRLPRLGHASLEDRRGRQALARRRLPKSTGPFLSSVPARPPVAASAWGPPRAGAANRPGAGATHGAARAEDRVGCARPVPGVATSRSLARGSRSGRPKVSRISSDCSAEATPTRSSSTRHAASYRDPLGRRGQLAVSQRPRGPGGRTCRDSESGPVPRPGEVELIRRPAAGARERTRRHATARGGVWRGLRSP